MQRGRTLADLERDSLLADLSAYLDGELSAARVQEVERLLAESPDARRTLDELRHVREQVRSLPRVRVPAELASAVARHAEQQFAAARQSAARSRWILRLVLPLTAAAAAVVALCVVIGYERQQRTVSATPQGRVMRHPAPPADMALPAAPRAEQPDMDLAAKTPEPAAAAPHELGSLGYVAAATAAEAAEPEATAPAAPAMAVVIQPRTEAEYARNAEMLQGWAARGKVDQFPAGRGGRVAMLDRGGKIIPGPAPQPVEYVYQLDVSDFTALVTELLEANPREQVAVESNSADGGAALTGLLEVADAQKQAAPAAAPPPAVEPKVAERAEKKAAPGGKAPAGGAVAGGEGKAAPRRPIVGDPRQEAARRERAHAQHLAVTEEPQVIIVNQPPPVSQPATRPAETGTLNRYFDLLLRGAPGSPGRGVSTTEPYAGKLQLRVKLLPAAASASQPTSGGAGD
jgi:hypothetical protein